MARRKIISMLAVLIVLTLGISTLASAEVTIRAWTLPGKLGEQINDPMTAEFMKKNPDIKVVWEGFPWEEFLQKIQLGFATGGVADVIEAWGGYVPGYIKGGHLVPVTPLAYTVGQMQSFFYPGIIEDVTIDGQVYGLPWEVCIDTGLNINVTLMEEAGIAGYPESWDELVAAAKKLVKFDVNGNMTRAGFSGVADHSSPSYTLWEFIYKLGGDPWAKDGIHLDLTTPEAEEAATLFTDLVVKHKVSSTELETAVGDQIDMFFSRQTAIADKGPQVVGQGKTMYADFTDKIDYIAIPPLKKGGKQVAIGELGWMWVITKASKYKEAAGLFVRWLGSPENLLERLYHFGHVPSAPFMAYDKKGLEMRPWFEPMGEMVQNLKMIGPVEDSDRWYMTFRMNLREVMDGRMTVKEALAKSEKEMNAVIDELR